MPGRNTLAYFADGLLTKKKSFTTLLLGAVGRRDSAVDDGNLGEASDESSADSVGQVPADNVAVAGSSPGRTVARG